MAGPNVYPRFLKGDTGGGGGAPPIVTDLYPTIVVSALGPQILTTDQKSPAFVLDSVESVPAAETAAASTPVFSIGPTSEPAPTANTVKDSRTPEVLISPVVDLKPRITDGDN